MLKIITIIGARPQFIKAAVVSRAIREYNQTTGESLRIKESPYALRLAPYTPIVEIIVHTGQHYDANMSQVFFDEMQIPKPDYYLEIGGGNHGEMTGRMLIKIEEVLLKEKPDVVLVYGDTNSTLAGALAAVKLHIPVAHVEAGLRSFNRMMPEEHNRVLTDHVSDYLFCPTETAVKNLKAEGFWANGQQLTADGQNSFGCRPSTVDRRPRVFNTGDVMYDAFLFYSKLAAQKNTIIRDLKLEDKEFVLCTIHRAENTDNPDRLRNIFEALNEISKEMTVVLPLHPRTRKVLADSQLYMANGLLPTANSQNSFSCRPSTVDCQLIIIDPVSYFDMLELLKASKLVMTDSGGVQKEAFFAKSPCVTLRDETEWVELVENGYNKIVSAEHDRIITGYHEMTDVNLDFDKLLYGSGEAGYSILEALCLAP